MSRPLRQLLAIGLGLLAALALPSAASATYPGVNGRIFFESCGNPCANYDIYSMNPDGTGLVNLTEALTTPGGTPEDAFDPSVSADGSLVAFGVDTQEKAEIWVMNADGTGAHQLTNDNLLDQEPTISPDGSRIAWNQFSPFPTYTDRDIWVMSSTGSGQELLFNGFGTDLFPQFTPDGQTIVMEAETGDQDIRKVPSIPAVPPLTEATGVAEDNELLESEPTVSPDGTRVAFTQTPKTSSLGPFDIYGVSIEGGARQPLFATSASETSPAYSPDGTQIVFDSDGVPMLGSADGTGIPTPLDVSGLVSVSRFDWAPAPPPVPGGTAASNPPPVLKLLPPKGRFGKHPKRKAHHRRARFTFLADESGAHFECKLDKRPFRPCRSPFVRTVSRGAHIFKVRAVNTEGTPDATPAVFRWKVLS